MSDDSEEICGYEKGTDGEPCEFTPSYPDGRCGHHTEHKEPEDKGRPTKLNKQRQEQIASAIENGRSIECASRRAGVDPSAVYSWINKGEDQEEGVYAEFYERLTRAKGEGEEFYMNLALQLAKENGDHRFIASLMKQRYPDSWGETETGVEAAEINVTSDVVEITEEDISH